MAGKRRRASLVERAAPKRVKGESDKKLSDLPLEIIDLILMRLIEIPNKYRFAPKPSTSIVKAFTAPIAQVSRLLRQRVLCLITGQCLWIEVKITGRNAWTRFDVLAYHLPILPEFIRNRVSLDLHCLEIHAGLSLLPKRNSPRYASPPEDAKYYLFPYNFDAFSRLCEWLRENARRLIVKNLLVRYANSHRMPLHILKTRIIPSLLECRYFRKIKFEVPRSFEPEVTDIQRMLGTPRGPADILKMARDVLTLSAQYMSEGAQTDARLKLLYSRWIFMLGRAYVPHPMAWQYGENVTADCPLDKPTYSEKWMQARNAVGNELRQLIVRLESEAALAFRDLYENFGPHWTMMHPRLLSMDIETWRDEHDVLCFGLSASDIARYHYACAGLFRVLAMTKEICNFPHVDDERLYWPISDGKYGYFPTEDINAADQAMFASWIQSDNPEYEKYSAELSAEWFEDDFDQFDELRLNMIERRSAVSGVIWKGQDTMLESWGGESSLQFWGLARKGLTD